MELIPILVLAALFQATPLNWAGDDGARVEELQKHGVRTDAEHVVLWTPADALTAEKRQELASTLNRGVPAIRSLVGRYRWQALAGEKITCYVSADRFISHATGRGAVFVPLARVQDGRAPLLHETSHEFLAARSEAAGADRRPAARPQWLLEGLADVIAQRAAAQIGVAEGDVFETGGLDGVDRTCASRLQQPIGAEVVRAMGENVVLPALFTTDRQLVAPTFYACSFSFTKFLAAKIGLSETVGLMPLMAAGGVPARIEKLTRMKMGTLREEWLGAIRQ